MIRTSLATLLFVPLLLAASPATAMQPEGDETIELRNTQWWFLTAEFVGSIALGFVVPDLFFPNRPETPTCANSWCEANGFDEAMQSVLAVKSGAAAPLGTTSHVFTIGLVPALGFAGAIYGAAGDGRAPHAVQDIVIILNTFLVSTGFNSLAKVGARRQRPAFYYERESNTEAASHSDEEFLSFYSGDTTWAFAVAASSSTLVILRKRRWAKAFTITAGSLALTGGLLRVISDMHWTTDMLVGAATGTAIGVAMPLLLHGRKGPSVAVVPTDGGYSLQVVGRW